MNLAPDAAIELMLHSGLAFKSAARRALAGNDAYSLVVVDAHHALRPCSSHHASAKQAATPSTKPAMKDRAVCIKPLLPAQARGR